MLRIAVLGCGRIGAMHAANIVAHPRARLAAVQDINSAAAEAVSASTGAPVMDSAAAIFASRDVDAVLIATATETHADLLEQAVAAGKPVLCEKPIDLSLERVNRCAKVIRGTRGSRPQHSKSDAKETPRFQWVTGNGAGVSRTWGLTPP
jgi:myo-inositol 2-dehydrogenase / D-chiro-inositol 1-dehydrogenase